MACAEERWTEFRSEPFQVITNGAGRNARDVLAQLDQVRYLLATVLAKPDLKTTWPVRILVLRAPSASYEPLPVPALARDSYVAAVIGNSLPADGLREVIGLLIGQNARRMPAGIERGIIDFYSTAQVAATRITLGSPPPPERRTQDWARIAMLATNPEYAGTNKLRVFVYNLQQGSDPDPAMQNGFGKSMAEIDRQAAAWLAAGRFGTVEVSGKPLNPLRDYTPRQLDAQTAAVALADLKLASGADASAAYRALLPQAPAAAHEGLAFLALRAKREDEAGKEFSAALAAGSTNARAWLEAARLGPDPAKAAGQLQKATELNPLWAEPYVLLAKNEADPSRKLHWLKLAAEREPRNAERWRAVAEMYQTHNKYPEAAKAWAQAETASVNSTQREEMVRARAAIDEKRLAFEDAERKRREQESEQELKKVKDDAMARIRAAEEKANKANPRANPSGKVVDWWEGDRPPGKVEGKLVRTECTGRVVRLVIQRADGRETRLLVKDARKIAVAGGGEFAFQCGAQTPAREVEAEYFPRSDPKLNTAGELATIEFK